MAKYFMFIFYYMSMITLNPTDTNIFDLKNGKLEHKNINFCSRNVLNNDTFEYTAKKIFLKIYNPFTHSYSSGEVFTALNKAQTFDLKHNSNSIFEGTHLKLDYDPSRVDYIFDKITQKPIKTVILKSINNTNSISYHFMSEKLEKEYGYVSFSLYNPTDKIAFNELLQDRPNQGIIGPKIVVDYLQNWNDKELGGIGHLSDKLIVKYCIDNNLPVNIVSVADRDSHLAHYLRGKRFFPLEESSLDYYKENFGETDINKILKRVSDLRNKNEKIKLKMGFLPMYMPKELVTKYINELQGLCS